MTGDEILDLLEADGWARTGEKVVRSGAVSFRLEGDEMVVGVGGTSVSPHHALSIARALRAAMTLR